MFKDIVATGVYAFSSTTNHRHYAGSETFPSADISEERSDESEDPHYYKFTFLVRIGIRCDMSHLNVAPKHRLGAKCRTGYSSK